MSCEHLALELLGLYIRGASIEELAALTGLVPEMVEARLIMAVKWAENLQDRRAVFPLGGGPPERFTISWNLISNQ